MPGQTAGPKHGRRIGVARLRALGALVALAAMLGCSDRLALQPDGGLGGEEVLRALAPGIHPLLVVAAQAGGSATVEVRLRRVEFDGPIASVQGELHYDAEKLKLAGAEVHAGVLGDWNEVEPGTLRFAGISPSGLGDDPVLTLTFETRTPVRAESFAVAIEEIVGGEGYQDLAPRLRVSAPHPVLIRGILPADH